MHAFFRLDPVGASPFRVVFFRISDKSGANGEFNHILWIIRHWYLTSENAKRPGPKGIWKFQRLRSRKTGIDLNQASYLLAGKPATGANTCDGDIGRRRPPRWSPPFALSCLIQDLIHIKEIWSFARLVMLGRRTLRHFRKVRQCTVTRWLEPKCGPIVAKSAHWRFGPDEWRKHWALQQNRRSIWLATRSESGSALFRPEWRWPILSPRDW